MCCNIYFIINTRGKGEDFIDAFISARGKGIQAFLYQQYDLCLLGQQKCQLTLYFCYKEIEDFIGYRKGLILDGCRVKVKMLFISFIYLNIKLVNLKNDSQSGFSFKTCSWIIKTEILTYLKKKNILTCRCIQNHKMQQQFYI